MVVGDARAVVRPERPGPVDAAGARVWRTFLRAHAQVLRRLEAELEESHGLPVASYDVLVQLAEAPEGRLRLNELAEAVLLSRSGLSRLVDRLVREGLVERVSCPSDARGTFAVLTLAGRRRLREASGTHLRGVAEHMLNRFTPEELVVLGGLLERLDPVARDETPPESACGLGA